MGQDHAQHGCIEGKTAKPVELKYLEEDARDHGHTSLAMAKDFPPGVKRYIVVYDL